MAAITPPTQFSWSEQYERRQAVARRYKTIFSVPLAKRVKDVLVKFVAGDSRVLEVGAGDRSAKQLLAERCSNVRYESLDIDPNGDHEYRDFREVTEKYDTVFAFEVAEHLSLDELPGWFQDMADCLKPGGRLLLSTPNTYYPPDFLRDATHQTPLCYDELGGLVESSGLKVEKIFRIYNDPLHRKIMRRFAFAWLFKMIRIDYAKQIVLVARKPKQG